MNLPHSMLTCVFAGRGINAHLQRWLDTEHLHVHQTNLVPFPDALAVTRNRTVEFFLHRCDFEWMLLLDDDIVPLPEMEAMLQSADPIAGCAYIGRRGAVEHPENGELAAGCLKVHRVVFEKLIRPYFMFEFTSDGLSRTACECAYFCRKAREAGYVPQRIGRVGHIIQTVAIPDADSRMRLLLPGDPSLNLYEVST